jgi:hypothetical protein
MLGACSKKQNPGPYRTARIFTKLTGGSASFVTYILCQKFPARCESQLEVDMTLHYQILLAQNGH